MAVKDIVKRILGYRLGGGYVSEMAIPPGWNYERYLEAYGQVGWLFGAVSLISHSVAQVEWQLFNRQGRSKMKEIESHPLLDLLDYANPFQTRYQFLLLLQSYVSLVGEGFIVLNFNQRRQPGEMWLASPGYMSIVPSSTGYISHYEYQRGSEKMRFEIPEVIHIMDPNPANPYRGIGAAKAAGMDIDAEYYAARYQQRLFYNDATPGIAFEFPDLPPTEIRKQVREEFLEAHQGWRNARKPAFLWGGVKINTIALAPKDMEFKELRNANKKLILGAYHIPDSLIGASEVGSRARAEADEYIFAKYTIHPALLRIREALNEQLCPLFGENLYLDFVNPVPEDETVIRTNNREDFKAGIITREEARVEIGLEPEAESGQTYLIPFNLMPEEAKMLVSPVTKMHLAEGQKEAYWQRYILKTQGQERAFKQVLRVLFDEQKTEVTSNLEKWQTADGAIFNETKAIEWFQKAFKPIIAQVYESALNDAYFDQQRVYVKQLNARALEWIATRSLSLAKMVNGTTKEQIRKVLTEGFELGESIPQITQRVVAYYGEAYKIRAEMVARTETIAASNEGALQGYQEMGVKKAEFYVALDERTCDECMGLHQKVYPVQESHGIIPVHPNCRCVWLPIVE